MEATEATQLLFDVMAGLGLFFLGGSSVVCHRVQECSRRRVAARRGVSSGSSSDRSPELRSLASVGSLPEVSTPVYEVNV